MGTSFDKQCLSHVWGKSGDGPTPTVVFVFFPFLSTAPSIKNNGLDALELDDRTSNLVPKSILLLESNLFGKKLVMISLRY